MFRPLEIIAKELFLVQGERLAFPCPVLNPQQPWMLSGCLLTWHPLAGRYALLRCVGTTGVSHSLLPSMASVSPLSTV